MYEYTTWSRLYKPKHVAHFHIIKTNKHIIQRDVNNILIVVVLRRKTNEKIKYWDPFSIVRTTDRSVEGRQKLQPRILTQEKLNYIRVRLEHKPR
jgi:hypothetical protein